MIEWKSVRRFLAPAALALALPGTVLAADCVEIYGIEHCAIGKARLSTTSSGLEVTDLGAAGMDGVSLRLGQATSGEMDAEVKGNAAGDASLVMTAFAGGSPISSRLILQQQGPRLYVSAWNGSVKVLQDHGSGTYAAVAQGLAWVRLLDELEPGDGTSFLLSIRGTSFGFSTQTGRGVYTVSFPASVFFVLPDGQKIEGDRLELSEKGAGGSFASFDGLQLTGTIEALTIARETFRR